MLVLGIIFLVLGAIGTVYGIGQVSTPIEGTSNFLGISCIFFGVILLIMGIMLILSRKSERWRGRTKNVTNAKEFTLVVVQIIILYIFWAINPNYLSLNNIRNIFNSAFVVGTIAVGMSCLLISGKLDLSAGNTGMLAGVLVSLLLRDNMPWGAAVIIVLLFGAVTGLFNAALVNGLNFTAFIATLAVSTIYGGLALVLTNAQTIPIGNQSFWRLASANVFGVFPLPFFIMIILLIAYGILLSNTRFGRRVYMVGGNASAARLAGINPKKVTTILYINNSVIACVVGILVAARMHMGSPSAISGSDLDAITASVLGGVAYTGGVGNMLGVTIGILVLTSFQNGLVVVGLDSFYQIVAKGLLLIAALTLDFYREKARLKALKTGQAEEPPITAE
jgi:ribose transport system permease protein